MPLHYIVPFLSRTHCRFWLRSFNFFVVVWFGTQYYFQQLQQETARLMARSDVPSPSGDFCAELPPGAWYCLSLADIARLTPVVREGGRRAMPADWDSVLLKYVKKTNPYCVFSCDQNRVKKVNSRKKNTPFFRVTLICTFPGCSVSAVVKILAREQWPTGNYLLSKIKTLGGEGGVSTTDG